jgi:hypothetical protein
MDENDDPRAELARMIYLLFKIRDIVTLPDPRLPNLQWYKSQVEHVRRYVEEALGDGCAGE